MAVTFTRRTQAIDEATGLSSETVTTITGAVFEKSSGEGDLLEAAKLTRVDGRVLGVTPDEYDIDAVILPGDEVEWPEDSGQYFTVRAARHVRPDGQGPIISFCAVSK